MQYIVFIRHGKAEAGSWNMDDFDRPLTKQGKKWIAMLAEEFTLYLQQVGEEISNVSIIHSNALRTSQTAEVFSEILSKNGYQINLENSPQLYDAMSQDIIGELIGRQEPVICLIGHNPAIAQTVEELTNQSIGMHPGSAICTILDTAELESPHTKMHSQIAWIKHPH